MMSLSARRAWIEMTFPGFGVEIDGVALRKESVDRNEPEKTITPKAYKSLSARRAWIEMPTRPLKVWEVLKSLSARRAWIEILYVKLCYVGVQRRSPQGERG